MVFPTFQALKLHEFSGSCEHLGAHCSLSIFYMPNIRYYVEDTSAKKKKSHCHRGDSQSRKRDGQQPTSYNTLGSVVWRRNRCRFFGKHLGESVRLSECEVHGIRSWKTVYVILRTSFSRPWATIEALHFGRSLLVCFPCDYSSNAVLG